MFGTERHWMRKNLCVGDLVYTKNWYSELMIVLSSWYAHNHVYCVVDHNVVRKGYFRDYLNLCFHIKMKFDYFVGLKQNKKICKPNL